MDDYMDGGYGMICRCGHDKLYHQSGTLLLKARLFNAGPCQAMDGPYQCGCLRFSEEEPLRGQGVEPIKGYKPIHRGPYLSGQG